MVHLAERRSLSTLEGMERSPRKTIVVRKLCDIILFS